MPRADADRSKPPTWQLLVRWKAWALPAIVLVAVLVLSGLGLNQSLVALLSPTPKDDPGLLVSMRPRDIRYDEYVRSTPTQVGNVRKGLPSEVWLGLTPLDLDATSLGAPTRSWTMVFRPQLLLMALAGPTDDAALERGFAFRWWVPIAVGILGVYALLLALRRRPLLAAVLALAVGLAPFVPWWSGTDLGLIVGFSAGAGAATLMAVRSSRWWRGLLWALASAWLLSAAFLVLYPPWLISVGLVVGLVVAGAFWDRRTPLVRLIPAVGVTVATSAAVLGFWLVDNRAAISTIAGTDYPGGRRAVAGEGLVAALLSAPTSFVTGVRAEWSLIMVDGKPLNLSERSSGWISAPVALVLVGLWVVSVVRARRSATADHSSPQGGAQNPSPDRWQWAALGAIVGSTVLVVWALVPLPAWVGAGLLERVPGPRTYVGIAVGFAILVHVAAGRVRLSRRGVLVVSAAVLAAAAVQGLRLANDLLAPGRAGPLMSVAASVVLAGALLAVILGGRRTNRVGALALTVLVVATYSVALPPYRGLGPLTSSPLARYLAAQAAAEGPSRWVSFEPAVQPIIAASANSLLSGMTYYPDAAVWNRLAPSQRKLWNNFRTYVWAQDPLAQPAVIGDSSGPLSALRINLCSPDTDFLDIRYAVSSGTHPVTLPCFERVATLEGSEAPLTVWRRTSGG